MLKSVKSTLESMEKRPCTSSIIVTDLLSFEKDVIACFKHCSESNLIYGDLISNVKQLLTELFKTTSEAQKLFFNILEKCMFDLTLKEDQCLLISGKKNVLFCFCKTNV